MLTLRAPQAERLAHMRTLLETDLGLPAYRITYFEGAAGSDWGRWPGLASLQRRRTDRSHWWLKPELCGNTLALRDIGDGRARQPRAGTRLLARPRSSDSYS